MQFNGFLSLKLHNFKLLLSSLSHYYVWSESINHGFLILSCGALWLSASACDLQVRDHRFESPIGLNFLWHCAPPWARHFTHTCLLSYLLTYVHCLHPEENGYPVSERDGWGEQFIPSAIMERPFHNPVGGGLEDFYLADYMFQLMLKLDFFSHTTWSQIFFQNFLH